MHKILSIIALLTVLLSVSPFCSEGSVINSKHNLAAGADKVMGDQPCGFCHIPAGPSDVVPLWDKNVTAIVYQVFFNSPANGVAANSGSSDGVSAVCLSCHDGSIAPDAVWNNHGKGFAGGADKRLGVILDPFSDEIGDNHPVLIDYPTMSTQFYFIPTNPDIKIYDGKIECASCHDVHNDSANPPFLRISNRSSSLCLACHRK